MYEFGPFRLDPAKRLLWRDSEPVPLQLKAFETLLVLVRNSQQVVLKDELMKEIWPNTFVEESNLSQNIFLLRKALGITADRSYIATVPGRGYRFTEKVRIVPNIDRDTEDGLVVESHSRTRMVIQVDRSPEVVAATTTKLATAQQAQVRIVVGVAIVLLAAAAIALRPTVAPPKVVRIRQITHLGNLVHNTRLVTDGPRIYFRAWEGKNRVIRYVSPDGGDVLPVEKVFPDIEIDDIAPNGSEFLALNLGDLHPVPNLDDPYPSVWRVPAPWGSPRPVGDLRARDVGWSPDGSTLAYALGSSLYLSSPDGSNPRKFADLPTEPFHIIWSPDGARVRFCVTDPQSTGFEIWQADLATHSVRPLFPDSPRAARAIPGGWSPDGRYFFYTSIEDGIRNVWAVREKNEVVRRTSSRPTQLTAGPLTFYMPLPGKDGKSIFAVGEQLHGQLVRYDSIAKQFVPYAQGISADHVTFSRDGQWMAYVEFPEGILVRSRADGSERQQLTFPPMRAFSPQWSPDGTEIAFQALEKSGAHNRIYVISSKGGVAAEATPGRDDQQTYPSWTSDGGSILFSSGADASSKPALYNVDRSSKLVSMLAGTSGLYLAQISPDGRSIVAVEDGPQRLVLYDIASHSVRLLAEQGDYPRWSNDGAYIYFSTPYFTPRGKMGGVYRWNVSTGATEMVTKYPEFLLTGEWGVCYGFTPEGDTLLVRDVSTRDLYALELNLP